MRIARVSGRRFRSYSLAEETRDSVANLYLIAFLLSRWNYKGILHSHNFLGIFPLLSPGEN